MQTNETDVIISLQDTLKALDVALHANHAIENQSRDSFQVQVARLTAARQLVEEALAHTWMVKIQADGFARFAGLPVNAPADHISMAKMRLDELAQLVSDDE